MSKDDVQVIPEIIYDSHTRTQYKKGRFFGKVSYFFVTFFAQCLVPGTISSKLDSTFHECVIDIKWR